MKYFRQRDKFRCAPVALLNVEVWLGRKVTRKHDLPRLCTLSQTTRQDLTTDYDVLNTMKEEGIEYDIMNHPTNDEKQEFITNGTQPDTNPSVARVKSIFERGDALLVQTRASDNNHHFVFAYGMTDSGKSVRVTNWAKIRKDKFFISNRRDETIVPIEHFVKVIERTSNQFIIRKVRR